MNNQFFFRSPPAFYCWTESDAFNALQSTISCHKCESTGKNYKDIFSVNKIGQGKRDSNP